MSATRAVSVLVVVVAIATSACSGGGAKKIDPLADLAVAKSAVLTIADVPGYTHTPYKPADDLPERDKRNFATCLKVEVTIFDRVTDGQAAHSDNFDRGTFQVSSSVEVDPTAVTRSAAWAALTAPQIEPCLEHLFEAILKAKEPKGGTFGPTSVTRFAVGVGSESVGFQVKVPVTVNKVDPDVYADLLIVARGRAAIELETVSIGTPFDRATESHLAQVMYDRIGTRADG